MRLLHITSLYSLIRIIEDGVFHAFSANPRHNDAGLNCFAAGQRATYGQYFEGVGAVLVLSWDGPVCTNSPRAGPHLPDVLYDMMPWRCYIPVGSRVHVPRIVRFRIDADVLDDYTSDVAPAWWPARWRAMRQRRAKLELLRRLRRRIRETEGALRIAGPA